MNETDLPDDPTILASILDRLKSSEPLNEASESSAHTSDLPLFAAAFEDGTHPDELPPPSDEPIEVEETSVVTEESAAAPTRRSTKAPQAGPWRYTEDLHTWSVGFDDEAGAVLHAREELKPSVYLGLARPIESDPVAIAVDVLDALSYRRELSTDELTAIGTRVTNAVTKILGAPFHIEPNRLVVIERERPQTLKHVRALLDDKFYDTRRRLFAADLAFITRLPLERLRAVVIDYPPAAILTVAEMFLAGDERSDGAPVEGAVVS